MPWKKKVSYNFVKSSEKQKTLSTGTYTKKKDNRQKAQSAPNLTMGTLVSKLPKQPNTKKLHKIL